MNRIFGFDPKTALALITHFGSARNIFNLETKDMEKLPGPWSKYRGQICMRAKEAAEEELTRLSCRGIQFCGITEDCYPPLLKECEDAPIGLYVRSATPVSGLWKDPAISIVGTRDISPYGKEWCRRIVNGMAKTPQKPAIISGLALGVDIEAHKAAVESGLPTIAVMATGPDSTYPCRHRTFADMLASAPGCALVTDYPPGTAPLAIHFLRRNRIIAGLGNSTILIESKVKGGGMMTCRLAFSYNREVHALPGRVDDLRSQGCNELIARKIAEPITSISSLMENLGMKLSYSKSAAIARTDLTMIYGKRMPAEDIGLMNEILQAVRADRGITVEEVAEAIGTSYRKTSELTVILETDGFITIDLLRRCSINPKNM